MIFHVESNHRDIPPHASLVVVVMVAEVVVVAVEEEAEIVVVVVEAVLGIGWTVVSV